MNVRWTIAIGLAVLAGCSSEESPTLAVTEQALILPFIQDNTSTGLVSMESEHWHFNTPLSGKSWVVEASGSASGGVGERVQPNTGTRFTESQVSISPRLEFRIQFKFTGTHYVWLRGKGPGSGDRSAHVGLDGVVTAPIANGFNSTYNWKSQISGGFRATINVTTTGVHTLVVWMRDDGFVVDKIVVARTSSYTPSGNGPAESPTGDV